LKNIGLTVWAGEPTSIAVLTFHDVMDSSLARLFAAVLASTMLAQNTSAVFVNTGCARVNLLLNNLVQG